MAGDPDAILAGLRSLYPTLIDLSLGRLERLLSALDHPERRLPPLLHVAGTNGKGSTCAFARAVLERSGRRVHVMTSPHLVSVTERFRIAGALVTLEALAAALTEVERVNDGAPITVFEALTAAGLLLFARTPADAAVIEVGLGGRLDATNVLLTQAATAVTAISLDHEHFLGDRLALIAAEKAGIMRRGVPCATGRQDPKAMVVLEREAEERGAVLLRRDRDWTVEATDDGLRFADTAGTLLLPAPSLPGAHQVDNAGIAIAALRAAFPGIADDAYRAIDRAAWPARLQRLDGRLAARLPPSFELWLDGGHNQGGADALATVLEGWRDRPVHLVVGMKDTKDPAGFLATLRDHALTLHVVAEPDQEGALPVETLVAASDNRAAAGPDLRGALDRLAREAAPGRVLICGSLHLAGAALALDGHVPG